MIDDIKSFHADLKSLRKDIKSESVSQIAKKSLRDRAEELGSKWFDEISSKLNGIPGVTPELLQKYSTDCAHLIRLSSPNNLKTSYVKTLDRLCKPFRNELILPAQQTGGSPAKAGALDTFFKSLANTEESEYLEEAINCAKSNYFKASVVLGWCACIDRIHRKIEKDGFTKFNVTSSQMASQTKGRYKRFNQTQNVSSIAELREVFDTTILWVIEGMGLIDSNQHTRLKSCFDMRCHGAHPGEAPITEYNLLSFFSDIDQIVLSNSSFSI
ncbi:MAG: hypothetical protein WD078_09260 [Woeseia sp.]